MFLVVCGCGLQPNLVFAECYITGCNGQTCSDEPEQNFGACEYSLQGQCYTQYGICEEDQNGVCNWRQSSLLDDCINNIQAQTAPSVTPTNEQPRSLPNTQTSPYDKAPRSLPTNPAPCGLSTPGSAGSCNAVPHAAY